MVRPEPLLYQHPPHTPQRILAGARKATGKGGAIFVPIFQYARGRSVNNPRMTTYSLLMLLIVEQFFCRVALFFPRVYRFFPRVGLFFPQARFCPPPLSLSLLIIEKKERKRAREGKKGRCQHPRVSRGGYFLIRRFFTRIHAYPRISAGFFLFNNHKVKAENGLIRVSACFAAPPPFFEVIHEQIN